MHKMIHLEMFTKTLNGHWHSILQIVENNEFFTKIFLQNYFFIRKLDI